MRSTVVPRAFWYLSLGGGTVLLIYALHRRDPVFALGQAGGLAIYARNLWFSLHPAAGGGPIAPGSG